MPFGFPAYTERVESFRGISRKKLFRLAEDALEDLGWRPYEDDKWVLRASVPMRFYVMFLIWGAKFTVEVEDGELFIRSEGSFPLEWMDVGQHSDNIKRFVNRLEDILEDEN